MTTDEPLRLTHTHASDETEGRALGLDLHRLKWVFMALVMGVLPGFACVEPLGLMWASLIIFGPAFIVAAFQFCFLQEKPPGWLSDWIETRLLGGNLSPLNDRETR